MELKFCWTAQDIIDEGRITQEEIDSIKEWVSKTEKIPTFSDELLVCLLLSCDRGQEFTQKTIVEYLKAKNGAPGIFSNRCIEMPEINSQLKALEFSIFPKRTEDGCAIIFHRLYDTIYSHYNMEPAMNILFMTLDRAIYEYPPTGLIVLFDMKGVGLRHLTRVRLGLLKTFFHYLQDGLPIKLVAIHVLNIQYFIDKVLALVKPFMKKEIYDMLHLHHANLDWEMFYEKHIPKSCLPEDFGGDLPNIHALHEENTRKLDEMKEFFEAEEKMRLR